MNIAVSNPLDSLASPVSTEDEIFARADQIGKLIGLIEEHLPFEIGDNYNRLVAIYGSGHGGYAHALTRKSKVTFTALVSQSDWVDVFTKKKIDELCQRMGVSTHTASNYAAIANDWPKSERLSGLTIKHYEAVATMDRGKAIALLQRAQMGDPPVPWKAKKPAKWKVWSVARVRMERKAPEHDPEAAGESAVTETVVTTKHELLEGVATALKGLPKAKADKVMRKVEKNVLNAVSEAANVMRDNMQKKIEEVTANTAKARREYEKEKQTYETLLSGVSRPVTQKEFRYLRQFCHPDKYSNTERFSDEDREKANKAYEIVERIGDRLQFNAAKRKAS